MNIVYISHLPDDVASGLAWSVPASVGAQCAIDNVLWVNSTDAAMEHWQKVPCFHKLSEFGKFDIDSFPPPFNRPEMVVFEGFYDNIRDVFFARKLRRIGIPYIIIPRGALTYKAMHNHAQWKKAVAHFFFYDEFIKKSRAIQYLTNAEYDDSKYRFDYRHFILPNGFHLPTIIKKDYSTDGLKALFIGRFDIHHKGLDLLLNACKANKSLLEDSGFILTLYGPECEDWRIFKKMIADNALEDIIILNGSISGKAKEQALLDTDVFIMTSRFEGHPMGLIEALSYGIPSCVTPGTNMRDEIENADAGWVCDGTQESINNMLVQIVKEKSSLSEKGTHARKLAAEYDWSKLAERFHHEVEKLING